MTDWFRTEADRADRFERRGLLIADTEALLGSEGLRDRYTPPLLQRWLTLAKTVQSLMGREVFVEHGDGCSAGAACSCDRSEHQRALNGVLDALDPNR